MGTGSCGGRTIASKAPAVVRKAKRHSTTSMRPMKSYRTEQGFTMELNLMGEGENAREAFLRGERNKD